MTWVSASIAAYSVLAVAAAIWGTVLVNRKMHLSGLTIPGLPGAYMRFSIRLLVIMVAFIAFSEIGLIPARIAVALTER